MPFLQALNWNRWFSVLLFLFPALILLREGSYNFTGGLLLLGAMIFCALHLRELRFEKDDKLFFAFLFSYPLILLLAVLLQGGKLSALDYPWRALAVLPIVLSMRLLSVKKTLPQAWVVGWIFGSIGAGLVAAYFVYWQGWLRVGTQITNEIPYGQIAAIMALGCILFLIHLRVGWQYCVCMIASAAAIFALASSGTRGAWLGFGVGLLSCSLLAIRWNWRRACCALLALTAVIVYVRGLPPVQFKLIAFKQEIRDYQHGNSISSLGARLDLWQQSFELAKLHPVLGVGPGNFKSALATRVADKPHLAQFSHAHSQYFDTLANAGFLGLSALLLSFLGPLYLFWRRFQYRLACSRVYALQGCALIICSMLASLTQPLYAHNISAMFYLICLSICWCFSGNAYNQCEGTEERD